MFSVFSASYPDSHLMIDASRPSQEVDVFHSVTLYSNPSDAVAGPSCSRYPESVTLAFTTPVSTGPFAIAGASTTVTAPLADPTPPPAKWWDTFALLNSDSTLRLVKFKWNRTCKHCGIKVLTYELTHNRCFVCGPNKAHLLPRLRPYPVEWNNIITHRDSGRHSCPLNNIFSLTALGVHDGDFIHFDRGLPKANMQLGSFFTIPPNCQVRCPGWADGKPRNTAVVRETWSGLGFSSCAAPFATPGNPISEDKTDRE
ncbi:hypothetical protein C8R45DRAFT_1105577 [Mycena sanguinolenta]|nr:hypothetical protein C8R45DRAFT_1105577 [Mycena sanguinolenta]